MAQKKVYDNEFKIQAVKLGREIGLSKAAKEQGINIDTLYGWNKRAKDARLDLGAGSQTPDTAMSLTEEVQDWHTGRTASQTVLRKLTGTPGNRTIFSSVISQQRNRLKNA